MAAKPRIYMDTSVIIDVLKYELAPSVTPIPGIPDEKQRYYIRDLVYKELSIQVCAELIKQARRKEIVLLTSSLTIAEVWHLGLKPCTKYEQGIIESVLTSGEVFILIPDSYFIATAARDLCWNFGCDLEGPDAIHVASAFEAKCDEFITADNGILSNNLILHRRKLYACRGEHTNHLPDAFKPTPEPVPEPIKEQADLFDHLTEIGNGQNSINAVTEGSVDSP